MKTIIHIGQHKTATTSIQHCLQENSVILEKQGLYIPDSLVGYNNPSHFILNVYALAHHRTSSAKDRVLAAKGKDFLSELKGQLKQDISSHYQRAKEKNCTEVIWSNEGLYLLNSKEEYQKLISLFTPFSSEITVVCCFREVNSYRKSYANQQHKLGLQPSNDKDSYRYLKKDSWLFDYERKKNLLTRTFDNSLFFSYSESDNVSKFMTEIGHCIPKTQSFRLNIS